MIQHVVITCSIIASQSSFTFPKQEAINDILLCAPVFIIRKYSTLLLAKYVEIQFLILNTQNFYLALYYYAYVYIMLIAGLTTSLNTNYWYSQMVPLASNLSSCTLHSVILLNCHDIHMMSPTVLYVTN